jgi:hypothetical protein
MTRRRRGDGLKPLSVGSASPSQLYVVVNSDVIVRGDKGIMLIGLSLQGGLRFTMILYAVISNCYMKMWNRRQPGWPRGFTEYEQTSSYAAGSINKRPSEKNHTCINIVAFIIVTLYM